MKDTMRETLDREFQACLFTRRTLERVIRERYTKATDRFSNDWARAVVLRELDLARLRRDVYRRHGPERYEAQLDRAMRKP